MKKCLIALVLLSFATASAVAQTRRTSKNSVVKKARPTLIREKFDPKRDPQADLDRAMKKASGSGKRIVLDVGGEWCHWCVTLDKVFIRNPKMKRLRDAGFIWVKVNWSEENENTTFLAAYPEIVAYPHLFILDEKGKLLHSQDTAVLEKGEKGYDLVKFAEFLKTWSPQNKPR